MKNVDKPLTTLDEKIREIVKDIYGKDVVGNAYASPAGRLTKSDATAAILQAFASLEAMQKEPPDYSYVNVPEERYADADQMALDARNSLRAQIRHELGISE